MNDEKMGIDTSVGGDGSGESFISISYSKGCKSYASFEVTDLYNTSDKKCSCWWQCFKYQGDPDVLYTNESSEKIGLEKDYPFIHQEADNAWIESWAKKENKSEDPLFLYIKILVWIYQSDDEAFFNRTMKQKQKNYGITLK